jgi:predicted ATPase
LPVLAGLFEKASTRTQLLLATHASYFLTQFSIPRLAVMKKVEGESYYLKPNDSATLMANLADFGVAELEAMHRNDELEVLT